MKTFVKNADGEFEDVSKVVQVLEDSMSTVNLYAGTLDTIFGSDSYAAVRSCMKQATDKTASARKATSKAGKTFERFIGEHELGSSVFFYMGLSSQDRTKCMTPETYVLRSVLTALIEYSVSDIRGEDNIVQARKNINQNVNNWLAKMFKADSLKRYIDEKVDALQSCSDTALKRQGVIENELNDWQGTKQEKTLLNRENAQLTETIQSAKKEIEEAKELTYADYEDSKLTAARLVWTLERNLFSSLNTYGNATQHNKRADEIGNGIKKLMCSLGISLERPPVLSEKE